MGNVSSVRAVKGGNALQLIKPTSSAVVWFRCARAADSDSLVVYVLGCAVPSALRDHWDNVFMDLEAFTAAWIDNLKLPDCVDLILPTCMCELTVLSPPDPHFQEVRLHQIQRQRLWRHAGWEASDSRRLWREVHPQQGAPVTLEGPACQLNPVLADHPSNKVVWLQNSLVCFLLTSIKFNLFYSWAKTTQNKSMTIFK